MLVKFKEGAYEVIIKEKSFLHLATLLNEFNKILIVCDDNVAPIYLHTLLTQIRVEKYYYIFRHGEKSKNIDTFLAIQKKLLDIHFTRIDLLIALGGGVCIDLTGFVAATYKRGIKYISIPTSTLAQVDSSIGGKTGIDFLQTKNVIGSFYPPYKVIIDLTLLKTLSKRDYLNGLYESLKMGLLFDKNIVDVFFQNKIVENISYLISCSIELKKYIVEKDPFEKKERRLLNFGHTIGHALESYYEFKNMLHGECVAQGMLYFIFNAELKQRLISLYNKLGLKLNLDYNIDSLVSYIKNDKKRESSLFNIVILHDIEKYEIKMMSIEEIKQILEKGL